MDIKRNNSQTIREDLHTLNIAILKTNEMVTSDIHPLLASLKDHSATGVKVIKDAHELCFILKKLDNAVAEIKQCLLLVEVVPFLDTIVPALRKVLSTVERLLSPISKILAPLDKDILNPASNVFSKIDVITSTLDNTLSEFSQHVPAYARSMTTIGALVNILELFEKLSGQAVNDDPVAKITGKIEATIRVAQDSIDSVHNTLVETTQAGKSLSGILLNLAGLTNQISSIVETVKSSVENIFAISDAMTKIKDAIAPLKWVLDAAKFAIEKLIEEPLNALLEYLHIQELIDDVADKIAAPMKDSFTFITNIEKYCSTAEINEIYKKINDECASTITSCLKNVNDAFEPFHLSNASSWRATLGELIQGSIGVNIDRDGLLVLSNWRIQPSLQDPS